MNSALFLLLIGWLLGLVSSLATGLFMFWLEGKRALRNEIRSQRLSDTRLARNWAAEGKNFSMRGYDLRWANLSGKDFSGADLEDADFEGSMLYETNFVGANLRNANFRRSKIVKANFANAVFLDNDFSKAIIRGSDFSHAHLQRVKLKKVKEITACTWTDTIIDEKTELPETLMNEIS